MKSNLYLPTFAKGKFSQFNEQQKKAVTQTEGKVLIIAGAGSGKTSVITHRIAYLIEEKKVAPTSILGLTFTNKAAEEMRERIASLLDPLTAKKIMLSTFHSFCMYVLRREIHHLGFTKEFSLYDERDIKRLLGHLAKNHLNYEEDQSPPQIAEIMQAKNQGRRAKDFISKDEEAKELFHLLEASLKAYNAVDFDTLLTLTVELFESKNDILQNYQEQFRYIMIDEYQDTSPVQDALAHLLSKKYGNLCVVGDDDQAIYSWRGANVRNILEFPASHIIKLEHNYRSTPSILNGANAVIDNNKKRYKKWLISQKDKGDPIHIFHASSEAEEATVVIDRMLWLRKEKNLKWKDMAILYRSNLLSRPFEVALIGSMWKTKNGWQRGIPYEIFGGTELYEKSEIKDLSAYLRTIANPLDAEAMLRIINYPRRGISTKTLEILTTINRKELRSLWSVLLDVEKGKLDLQLTGMGKKGILNFLQLIRESQKDMQKMSLYEASKQLVDKLELKKQLTEETKNEKSQQWKWENINQYLLMIKDFEKNPEVENPSLPLFLSSIAVESNFRRKKDIENDSVKLMTFHSSKGLEFPACFLIALEEFIVPHEKGILETSLEEERRLFYVAMTRAKKYLTLSMARSRKRRGKDQKTNPSRFLFEIPKELLKPTGTKTIDPFMY